MIANGILARWIDLRRALAPSLENAASKCIATHESGSKEEKQLLGPTTIDLKPVGFYVDRSIIEACPPLDAMDKKGLVDNIYPI